MTISKVLRGWRAGACVAAVGALLLSSVALAEQKGEWTMTGRTPDLQRFSPLDQIKPSNVAGLGPTRPFSTGAPPGPAGNPLLIGSVLSLHSPCRNTSYSSSLPSPRSP